MRKIINKFERIEKKYLLTKEEYNTLLNDLTPYLIKDDYYESNILNIYFDTSNSDLIRMSIDKPLFKEKVRLRSYGVPSTNSNVFLEIKSKYNKVVTKRRISLKLKDFYDYYYHNKLIDNQIMKEIDYLFKYYNLKPNLFLAYNRLSYKLTTNPNVRITFDTSIRSRDTDLFLELGDSGKLLFKDKLYLMEIKALGSMPIDLVNILSQNKIYPTSFSKYGEIYKKKRIGEQKCLTI